MAEETKVKRLLSMCQGLKEEHIIGAIKKYPDKLFRNHKRDSHFVIYNGNKYNLKPVMQVSNNEILNNKDKITPYDGTSKQYASVFKQLFSDSEKISYVHEINNSIKPIDFETMVKYFEGDKQKEAYKIFKSYADEIKQNGFESYHKNWWGGKFPKNQLWSEFKKRENDDLTYSISLFFNEDEKIRVTLECFVNYTLGTTKEKWDKETFDRYKSVFKKYQSDTPDGFEKLGYDYRKFERVISGPYKNDRVEEIIEETQDAFNDLIEKYDELCKLVKTEDNEVDIFEDIKEDKNIILYGPPGTGKTYNTIKAAMKIVDEDFYSKNKDDYEALREKFRDYKKQGQISFITFHQSYSYEEFVEGIKPDVDNENLEYKLNEGVFKNICNEALFERINISNECKNNIDDFRQLREKFINEYEIGAVLATTAKGANFKIEKYTPKSIRITPINGSYTYSITYKYLEEALNKAIAAKEQLSKIKGVASGLVGYYYAVYDIMKKFKEEKSSEQSNPVLNNDFTEEDKIQIIEDFYESKTELKDENDSKNYVLIIDEINRGNISKIFGELITLIEDDKREKLEVTLPYSQTSFTVPKNLYIIGTMNTSDRSIASVDIALRRRFKFKEMMPDSGLVADFDCEFDKKFKILNQKISLLLDRDHQIGHSYFINTKYNDENNNNTPENLKKIWFDSVLPLLNEYFYGDWEKLQAILGDAKSDGTSFIKEQEISFNKDDESFKKCYDEENRFCFDLNVNFKSALEHAFK